jgi:hypothetical protein
MLCNILNRHIDEYIERNEQIESERKMKAIEAEYIKSGYWPSDDECVHQMRDGRCEWCGKKEEQC